MSSIFRVSKDSHLSLLKLMRYWSVTYGRVQNCIPNMSKWWNWFRYRWALHCTAKKIPNWQELRKGNVLHRVLNVNINVNNLAKMPPTHALSIKIISRPQISRQTIPLNTCLGLYRYPYIILFMININFHSPKCNIEWALSQYRSKLKLFWKLWKEKQ